MSPSMPLEEALPHFAPLPRPMVEHLLKRLRSRESEQMADAPEHLDPFHYLQQRVQTAQQALYAVMDSFVRSDQLTTSWLLKTLALHAPQEKPVSTQTFALWRERGLVRYRERGHPDPTAAAALLIARAIDDRERNFLPATLSADEPQWWCWRQDEPDAPIVTCPVPLPQGLPASALLWTPWPGAAWENTWLPIGTVGAIRWAGQPNKGPFAISPQQIAFWDAEVATVPMPPVPPRLHEVMEHEFFALKAQLMLLRLALPRLAPKEDQDLSSEEGSSVEDVRTPNREEV